MATAHHDGSPGDDEASVRTRDEVDHAPPAPATGDWAPVPGVRWDGPATVLLSCSLSGTVLAAGAAFAALSGHPCSEVLGAPMRTLLQPWSHAQLQHVLRAARNGSASGTTPLRIRHADGSGLEVDTSWSVLTGADANATQVVFVCSVVPEGAVREDVSAWERDRAVRASEARFRAIAEASAEGIWVVSTAAETLYANTRVAAILGVPAEQTGDLLAVLDPWAAAVVSDRPGNGSERGAERSEIAYPHPDGCERRLLVSATPLHAGDGTPEGSLVMISDITDVRRAEQELRTVALEDTLTQLPNRTLLFDRLTHALTTAGHSTAVLLVDLDHFRMLNDSRGHDVGDQLLVGVGARLRAAALGNATVARFGGDEFVIVCEDADEDQGQAVARGLVEALAEPFLIGGAAVHVAASIGVTAAQAGSSCSAADLVRQADTAVHAAKGAGRARVHVFEQTLGEDVEHRYALSADLRAALAAEVLHLEYQPIVDLRTGAVVGMEALARWTHPERGPVPPGSFVTVAEITGLAPELDRWVLRRAVFEMAALREAGAVPPDAYVAVNLSAASLTDAFDFGDLLSWTRSSGLPPTQVVLEITETAIMQNADAAVALLRRLREQGFRVAMDDFGTGYSSLAYLRDLPISALKIDRSFVAGITERRDALAIVASIVELARAVGVAVVAEGVETPQQNALLRRLGVVTAQGWLWSTAVPASALSSGREWLNPIATVTAPTSHAWTPSRPSRDAGVGGALRRLLELHQYGAPLARIAAALNAEGYPTPAGQRWEPSSVARVIAHQIRRYAGPPDTGSTVRRSSGRVEGSHSAGRAATALDMSVVRPSHDTAVDGALRLRSLGQGVEEPGRPG
ncbi:PAS domain S-box-containing protein/diguanylate cyclase (GGDEF)-like protein [Blastococcus colisei]|uniref:PAS domain S-box-containing protein/diguanylate cyclase (GGDEF)-like protein n=1 Tax=Blastococcus colisei TaxID=1564162 RepID=A0A543PFZ6_9ACTN|nr:EAL domain-containing protein [Blastococcus colisei]TQN42956.1 PAS domain S-box-containing protein/diguanylate cyclase (GGDEF)-like protein [Blastococcus colisei]